MYECVVVLQRVRDGKAEKAATGGRLSASSAAVTVLLAARRQRLPPCSAPQPDGAHRG